MEDNIILREKISECLRSGLLRGIISNPVQKGGISKIKIRQVVIGGESKYQATEYIETKVIHKNFTESEITDYITDKMGVGFKQCEILTNDWLYNILVSKKGKVTINKKVSKAEKITAIKKQCSTEHNRKKNYIIEEGSDAPFMVELGVFTREGKIVNKKYDKYKQINRFLEFIKDVEKELPRDREIRIIDFGCGKSYLTFAMYYYLHDMCGRDVMITGLDLKKDVIEKCNRLSEKYGYHKLKFKLGDIADYEGNGEVDMVVTLHACDTATDYALFKAVNWNAKVILSVPCCQHELNRQIKNDTMSQVLSYGILKDRFAAIMTDAIRAEMLKVKGYDTDILEFIDMEHTPKNLLIRAVKNGKQSGDYEKLKALIDSFHAVPTIVTLFKDA